MDNSAEMKLMLDSAMRETQGFDNFDVTKNVQDQLQEMFPNYGRCFDLLVRLSGFWHHVDNRVGYCTSMEQLWLAFVMKEKYSKKWSGDKWEVWDGITSS